MRLIDAMRIDFDEVDISGCTDVDDIIAAVEDLIDAQPTVDAAPVNRNPCGFCARFDFGGVKTQIDKYGARIVIAVACGEYPIREQFNFCPVCGRSLKEGAKDAGD